MLNTHSQKSVDASTFSAHFIKPLYSSYCFSRIPATIEHILTKQENKHLPLDVLPKHGTIQKVLFLFIDSFGWKWWDKYKNEYPFLKRFLERGMVSKLTSQFPSTTAAHVTTIHTGLEPGQSGVHEWFYYEPLVGRVIAPLLYSYAGDKARETLTGVIKPYDAFPFETIYQRLAKKGVASHVFQYKDYAPSPYTDVTFTGATLHQYRSFPHALTLLSSAMNEVHDPSYFFLYYDPIDTSGHINGPDSPERIAEIHNAFTMLEDLLFKQIESLNETMILLSADHGMANVSPDTTFYINKKYPDFEKYLKRGIDNMPLVPAGSARDLFLYIKKEYVKQVVAMLKKDLKGKAEVYETRTLIQMGFFSEEVPSQRFLDRVGNVVILPYDGYAVWWYKKDMFEMKYFGHHGGGTRVECEIPFLSLAL